MELNPEEVTCIGDDIIDLELQVIVDPLAPPANALTYIKEKVNYFTLKKAGQFMAPEDMLYAVGKVRSTGNNNVLLTESGFSLGYHDPMVRRALPIMRQFAPVVFDVTHSVQRPGAKNESSRGKGQMPTIQPLLQQLPG
jgi:3-deoxy-D-manno-octulosonic acid (KDO) 8-phosphate synthase